MSYYTRQIKETERVQSVLAGQVKQVDIRKMTKEEICRLVKNVYDGKSENNVDTIRKYHQDENEKSEDNMED